MIDRLPPESFMCGSYNNVYWFSFNILVKLCKHNLKEETVRKFMAIGLTDSYSESEVEYSYRSEDESFDNKFVSDYNKDVLFFYLYQILMYKLFSF